MRGERPSPGGRARSSGAGVGPGAQNDPSNLLGIRGSWTSKGSVILKSHDSGDMHLPPRVSTATQGTSHSTGLTLSTTRQEADLTHSSHRERDLPKVPVMGGRLGSDAGALCPEHIACMSSCYTVPG